MSLKALIKVFASRIRWGRIKNKFRQISSVDGFHWNGKIVAPKYISIGRNFSFARGFMLQCFPSDKLTPELIIGDNFWTRDNITIFCAKRIVIGNNVTCAKDVFISDENHGLCPLTDNYRNNPLETLEVVIEDGCWLGERVCVLPGVHIGKKCIIGAGSVVTRDIPDYCIAAGNPCKILKTWNEDLQKWEKCY